MYAGYKSFHTLLKSTQTTGCSTYREATMLRCAETAWPFAARAHVSYFAVVVLAVLGAALSLQTNADAAATSRSLPSVTFGRLPGDDQHNGNGRFNRNSSPFNSPNNIRGSQTIINANSGGNTISQSSACKRKFHCRLVQKAYAGGW